jgi:ADP-ribose pyrophosphatase
MAKIVHKNNWFWVEKYNAMHERKSRTYVRMCHINEGCTTIPIKDGKIVLERQYRYNLGKSFIELPGGGIEKKETSFLAAEREITEETGRTPKATRYLFRIGIAPEFSNSKINYFSCNMGKKVRRNLDMTEQITPVSIPLSRALSMIRSGKINNNISLIGILYYATFMQPEHKQR